MDNHLFWLAEEQFARLGPHLPIDTRGKARVDDRRVLSGIVHVLNSSADTNLITSNWLGAVTSVT